MVKKRHGLNQTIFLTPDKFNGQMFLKEIDQLGNTAKELFGNETGKIRELATKIAKTDFNNLTKETIEKYGRVVLTL